MHFPICFQKEINESHKSIQNPVLIKVQGFLMIESANHSRLKGYNALNI
jgi:hypothetical protein